METSLSSRGGGVGLEVLLKEVVASTVRQPRRPTAVNRCAESSSLGRGARTSERAKSPFNTRGFSRLWGEAVRRDGFVGCGDGDRRRVLYVRVQTAPPESKNQPAMALGLSGALCHFDE